MAFILSPNELPAILWRRVAIFCALVSASLVAYTAAFSPISVVDISLSYVMDVVHLVDMILRARFIALKRKGLLVEKRSVIFKEYLKRDAVVDVVGLFPMELIPMAVKLGGGARGDEVLQLVGYYRLNRLVKLWKVITVLEYEGKLLNANTGVVRLIKSLTFVGLTVHFQACLWYAIACDSLSHVCGNGTWPNTIDTGLNFTTASSIDRYVISLYWAVATCTSTGYGDIYAVTFSEKWLSVVCMLNGIFLFGFILGGLASSLTNVDALRARYSHLFNTVKEYLFVNAINQELTDKVKSYYNYMWTTKKGIQSEDLFHELPRAFQAEVALKTNRSVIEEAPIFSKTSAGFRRMLATKVKAALFLPGQMVVSQGEVGENLWYLHRGTLEVLEKDETTPIVHLRTGKLFGEVNLIHRLPRICSIRAVTHCDLLTLNRSDLLAVLKHYPDEARLLQEVADERFELSSDAFHLNEGEMTEERPPQHLLDLPRYSQLPLQVEEHFAGNNNRGLLERIRALWHWWKDLEISPTSKFVWVWRKLVLVVILLVCIIHPLEAAFIGHNAEISYAHSTGGIFVLTMLYVFDVVCWTDIILTVKMDTKKKEDPNIVKEDGQEKERRPYIWSVAFVVDVVAVLPFELAALGWSDGEERWKVFAYFRLNRMIKLYKFPKYFGHLEDWLESDIGTVRAFKFFVYITLMSHVVSCLWFEIACSSAVCTADSWANHSGVTNVSTVGYHYIVSLYWTAATMTSTGYGDVRAYLTEERIVAMIVMLLGFLLYGYCLTSIAATLANAAFAKVNFQERMTAVKEFMHEHRLNSGLIDRAQLYFGLLWRQNRGQAVPGSQRLMHDMPMPLQREVALQEAEFSISKVPLFESCGPSFLRELAMVTHAYAFSPGEFVMYAGDIGRELYLVKRGIVEIMSDNLKHVVCTIEPGGYFGEVGLMYGDVRSATYRASTYCEILMIAREDLDRILDVFPIIGRQFASFSENRDHLIEIHKAAAVAMTCSSQLPVRPSKCSIISALAMTLNSSLAAVTRTELATTVAASIPDTSQREKVACSYADQLAISGTFVWRPRISEVRGKTVLELSTDRNREMMARFQPLMSCDVLAEERPPRRPSLSVLSPGGRPSLSFSQRRYSKISPAPSPWVAEHRRVGVGGLYSFQDNDALLKRPGRIAKLMSRLLMPLAILPNSRFCAVWETIAVILAVVSAITVSIQAAFFYDDIPLLVINYLIDIFFLIDMYKKFHTAFYNEFSTLVLEPLSCARHYIRTNFVLDLICCFPTDFLVFSVATGEHALAALALFRLNRLLRVYKLYQGLEYLESDIGRSTGLIRQIKFLIYIIIGSHWTACAWFLLVTVNDDLGDKGRVVSNPSAWINKDGLALGNVSVFEQYLVSLYFAAATTVSVGYGDIRGHTEPERCFALAIMILGIVCYGYIIASVAATLANADAQRGRYQEKLTAIKTFIEDQDLCPKLQKRVMKYYEYLWEKNKGVQFKSLFQGMPNTLQADITLSLYKKILDEVPLFQNTELGFAKLLSMSIKPIYFLPGEYVVRKFDLGSEMFFIHRGTVEVVSEDGEVVFAKMTEGSFFGEISLVYSVPRTASIRAATNCDLFVLTKQDLDSVLSHYPHIERQINDVAEKRRQNVRKRSEATKTAKAAGVSAAAAALRAAAATKEEEGDQEDTTFTPDVFEIEEARTDPLLVRGFCERLGSWWRERVGSRLCRMYERIMAWNRFTIHPNNTLWRSLQYTIIALSFITFVTISYQAAFQDHSPALWILSTIFEPLFLLELYLEFHIAYDDHGALIRDFSLVCRRYLKKDFVWDVIPSLPTLLVFILLSNNFEKELEVYSYIQLIRIVRLYKVIQFFNVQSSKLNTSVMLARISKFVAIIMICTHAVACIWYMIACTGGCRSTGWVNHEVMAGNRNLLDDAAARYGDSIYWAVASMTSTGYGDIHANNNYERMFSTIVMVLGKLLFGFVLGNITSTLANAEIRRVHYDEKMDSIKKHMSDQQLPADMKKRVLTYYEYLWERNKGVDGNSLFDDMPLCMKAEVYLNVAQDLLEKIPLFEGVETSFMRNLAVNVRPTFFLPGNYALRQGDTAEGMYCIKKGKVDVLDGNDRVIRTLSNGDFFSDDSLIRALPSEYSFRAATAVDALSLLKSDVDAVLVHYPEIQKRVDDWQSSEQQSS